MYLKLDKSAEDYLVPPKAPYDLKVPASRNTVKVSCIDTTTQLTFASQSFMKPHIPDHDTVVCPSYAFLLEHEPSGQNVLFDLGVRKDWKNMAPAVIKLMEKANFKAKIDKNVSEILTENGFPLEKINAIIWSHHHWDHQGAPSLFPKSTALVVGPGFKDKYTPGYPANPESSVLESDYEGREFREIDFKKEGHQLKVGRFPAYDYFGDGSFYLLDTPGHSTGHLCGLARTTSEPDTFVFFGGDACHHAGEIRPTEYMPLPARVTPEMVGHIKTPCPGSVLQDMHPEQVADEPFYKLADSMPEDLDMAQATIDGMEEFDSNPNVLMAIAHDSTFQNGHVLMYPGTMNKWKKRGEKEKVFWRFLEDFHIPGYSTRKKNIFKRFFGSVGKSLKSCFCGIGD